MTAHFGIFLLLFTFTLQQTPFGCTVIENSFVYFQNLTNFTSVNVFSHNINGWLCLSFGNSNDVMNHTLFIVGFLPGKYYFYNSSSFQSRANLSYSVDIYNIFEYVADDILYMRIDLPYQFLKEYEYIGISRNFNSISISSSNIQQPNEYFSKRSVVYNESLPPLEMTFCTIDYFKLPGRILDYHLGIFIPTLVFYILLMILCLLFINVQPLKSRGLGPFFIPFFLALNLIVEFISNSFTYEVQITFRCIVSSYVLQPLLSACGVIPLITYFRYLLLYYSNLKKEKFINNDTITVQQLPLYLRMINKITNPIILLIFLALHFIIWSILVTISFAIFKFGCGSFGSTLNSYFNAAYAITYAVVVGLLQLFDLLINIKLVMKCELKRFYIDKDPYSFRLEFLLTILLFVIGVIWVFIPTTILKIITVDLGLLLILWNFSLLVLLITIYKWIKSKIEKNPQLDEMGKLFQNQELKDLFVEYCKKEWSLENALFYQDSITYRNSTEKKRSDIAERMKRLYLSFEMSPLEINVPAEKIQETLKKLEENQLGDDLFKDLEGLVAMNMRDTSLRFIKSYEYQLYLVKNKLIST